jgi:hypothetical protein
MARKPRGETNVIRLGSRKTGKPKALEVEEIREQEFKQTPEEFAKEFFGDGSTKVEPQDGMPTLSWLKEHYKTKSAAIRYLHSGLWHPEGKGATPLMISKHLGIRYQHARNVCTTELKRGPNEDWRPKETITPKPVESKDDDGSE